MPDLVLLIEDEPDVRLALRTILQRADLEPIEAATGSDGLRMFFERRPDLVVLDVGLPDMDGWSVLERIRDLSDLPVLMLTARGLDTEKVRGLQAGADDYVTKPFSNAELVARIQALLRRSAGSDTPHVEVFDDGHIFVDYVGRNVRAGGEEVALTALEFRLLGALVRHAGNVLSAEQLLEQAWHDPLGIGPERVKYAIARLRKKLEPDDPAPSRIESVRGLGYRYRTDR